LTTHVIEKDWALGWVLAGIGAELELTTWVFKGGTSLRKCYYETYRFSEDLDFTVVDGGLDDPELSLGRHPRTHRPIAMSSQ
jgi:predicted nucleotidyltransferase component of viral defense system